MPVIAITSCRKLEDYRQSVLHVGGEVRIVGAPMAVGEALAGVDGLILTGGDDIQPSRYGEAPHPTVVDAEPGRDAFELDIVREARSHSLPIFAICRGIQELNVALGGTLHQRVHELPGRLNHRSQKDSRDGPYGPAHRVALSPGGLLALLAGSTEVVVNSLQARS